MNERKASFSRGASSLSLVAIALSCGPSADKMRNEGSELSAVYNEDNRMDVADQRVTLMAKQRSRSVGLLINTADLTEVTSSGDGEKFVKLNARSLRDTQQLCSGVRFEAQPAAGFCTGFLVSKEVIATAGHCVTAADSCAGMSFVFDYFIRPNGSDPTVIPAKSAYRCREIVARELNTSNGNDFALIRLDRPVTDRQPLKFDPYGRAEPGQMMALVGHPSGLPMKVAVDGMVTGFDPQMPYFKAGVDAFHGNSGSPVFDSVNGIVRGILVRGFDDYIPNPQNSGCRVLNKCTHQNCAGEDVTRSSVFAAALR